MDTSVPLYFTLVGVMNFMVSSSPVSSDCAKFKIPLSGSLSVFSLTLYLEK